MQLLFCYDFKCIRTAVMVICNWLTRYQGKKKNKRLFILCGCLLIVILLLFSRLLLSATLPGWLFRLLFCLFLLLFDILSLSSTLLGSLFFFLCFSFGLLLSTTLLSFLFLLFFTVINLQLETRVRG